MATKIAVETILQELQEKVLFSWILQDSCRILQEEMLIPCKISYNNSAKSNLFLQFLQDAYGIYYILWYAAYSTVYSFITYNKRNHCTSDTH